MLDRPVLQFPSIQNLRLVTTKSQEEVKTLIDQFLLILINNYKNWLILQPQAQISFLRPKSGGYLRFESNKYLGDFNFWDSLECEISILSLRNGEIVFQEYKILNNPAEMDGFIDFFIDKFINLNSEG